MMQCVENENRIMKDELKKWLGALEMDVDCCSAKN